MDRELSTVYCLFLLSDDVDWLRLVKSSNVALDDWFILNLTTIQIQR